MALIQWTADLSVGVKKFDDQHKILIDRLNALHDAMRNGKSNELIAPVLDDLLDYTVHHFGSEEEAFERFGYPQAEKHMAEHKGFTDKVVTLRDDLARGKLFISVDVLDFLVNWVQNHIKGSDADYETFLADKVVEA